MVGDKSSREKNRKSVAKVFRNISQGHAFATGNVNSGQPKQTGLNLRTIFPPSDTHIFRPYHFLWLNLRWRPNKLMTSFKCAD